MDKILIEDLLLRCIVGINADERVKEQDVNLQIVLFADLLDAGRSDDMEDTVDYKAIKMAVKEFVEASSFFLIEKLAHEVARICLQSERVHKTVVKVEKPGALRFARTVAVEIERTRDDYPDNDWQRPQRR